MEVQDQPATPSAPRPVCSEIALEQIRQSVSNGFLALGHGGLEVGGVLLGRVGVEETHIEASQPLMSEHAFGPSLQLSPADEQELSRLISQAGTSFPGLKPVGWYRSYTRREAAVMASDLAVMNRYFPEPGRALLLLKPTSPHRVSGLFFVRGTQGDLNLDPVGEALVLRPNLDFTSTSSLPAPEPATPLPASVQREAPSKFGRPFLISLICAALVCIAAVATLAWPRLEHPGARKLAVPPAITEPPSKPSPTPEQLRNAELEMRVAELAARNRRLEETLTILQSKSLPHKAKRKGRASHRVRK